MAKGTLRRPMIYALAVFVAAAAAASGPAATSGKSPVFIEAKAVGGAQGMSHAGTFKLVWNHLDKGKLESTIDDYRSGERDGQPYELVKATDSLIGAKGTLVVRTRDSIGVSAGSGYSVLTGRWTVVSGTGAYAGVRGGGRAASVVLPARRGKVTSFTEYYGFLIRR